MNDERQKRALASVFMDGDAAPFVVAELPSEVAAMVLACRRDPDVIWIECTLANSSSWNGRSVYIEGAKVRAISPPMTLDDE